MLIFLNWSQRGHLACLLSLNRSLACLVLCQLLRSADVSLSCAHQNAKAKRLRKGCDWIIANQVVDNEEPVFGSTTNKASMITEHNVETWPKMRKTELAEKLANEYRIPLVRFIEGTGGGGSVKSLEEQGFSYVPFNPGWDLVVDNLSKVPVISLALGPVAGLGAARLVSSHYSIMIKKTSQICLCAG